MAPITKVEARMKSHAPAPRYSDSSSYNSHGLERPQCQHDAHNARTGLHGEAAFFRGDHRHDRDALSLGASNIHGRHGNAPFAGAWKDVHNLDKVSSVDDDLSDELPPSDHRSSYDRDGREWRYSLGHYSRYPHPCDGGQRLVRHKQHMDQGDSGDEPEHVWYWDERHPLSIQGFLQHAGPQLSSPFPAQKAAPAQCAACIHCTLNIYSCLYEPSFFRNGHMDMASISPLLMPYSNRLCHKTQRDLTKHFFRKTSCFSSMMLMQEHINSQMTSIAARNTMFWNHTQGLTLATVRDGQHDNAIGPDRGLLVAFDTAPGARMGAVQATVAGTTWALTLPLRPPITNVARELFPSRRIKGRQTMGHRESPQASAGSSGITCTWSRIQMARSMAHLRTVSGSCWQKKVTSSASVRVSISTLCQTPSRGKRTNILVIGALPREGWAYACPTAPHGSRTGGAGYQHRCSTPAPPRYRPRHLHRPGDRRGAAGSGDRRGQLVRGSQAWRTSS